MYWEEHAWVAQSARGLPLPGIEPWVGLPAQFLPLPLPLFVCSSTHVLACSLIKKSFQKKKKVLGIILIHS